MPLVIYNDEKNDNIFINFLEMAQPPRQPRDFEGLLKFCMEATKAEDAPNDPDAALRAMDTERRQWLEQAMQSMSVDVIKGSV